MLMAWTKVLGNTEAAEACFEHRFHAELNAVIGERGQ